MARDRRDRLDAATAERLLTGSGGGPAFLADLISAAAAPPHPGETAGEASAVAAFSATRDLAGEIRRHRVGSTRPRLARWLTVKAIALGLAVAAGGVALAAGTGVLPNPLHPGPAGPGRSSSHSATPSAASDQVRPSNQPSRSPSPSLDGLCNAYLKQLAADREGAKHSPAFASLFAAAGGLEKAEAYCELRLATPAPDRSHEHPTGPPSPHPTGPPSLHPTGAPNRT